MTNGRLANKPGAVSHQMPERDLLSEGVGGFEIRQVTAYRRIEIEDASLNELHDADIGKQLGDGADTVHRFRRGRNLVLRVGPPEASSPDDLLVVHQGDGKGR